MPFHVRLMSLLGSADDIIIAALLLPDSDYSRVYISLTVVVLLCLVSCRLERLAVVIIEYNSIKLSLIASQVSRGENRDEVG